MKLSIYNWVKVIGVNLHFFLYITKVLLKSNKEIDNILLVLSRNLITVCFLHFTPNWILSSIA